MVDIAIYLVLGLFAGLASGLFGIGGGAVIVPVLMGVFMHEGIADAVIMQLALGTSLATIVATSVASIWAHQRRGAIRWRLVGWLVPGLGLGAVTGAWVAHGLNSDTLQLVFGLFELWVASHLLRVAHTPAMIVAALPCRLELSGVGLGIGALSSLLGIGGGTMTVPYLGWRGVPMSSAVAISAACGLPIACFGTLGYVMLGWGNPALPAHALGFVYWPALVGVVATSLFAAPVGARLAHQLPGAQLRRGFGLLLLFIGIIMIIKSIK